jgi:hypothetical protein
MHDSIHDMESFMWVVVYLCLTRNGPGGERRDELRADSVLDNAAKSVHTIVYCFFDTGDRELLSRNKSALFRHVGDMEAYVMSRFHPYFDVIKPMVSEWWRLLQQSYRFSEFTTIHDQFLHVINGVIQELEQDTLALTCPDADGATIQELERRSKDLERGLICRPGTYSSSDSNAWGVSPDRVTLSASSYRPGAVGKEELPSSPTPPRKKGRTL